jgi:tripartite ATP-independent transporter DctP family solute receptor
MARQIILFVFVAVMTMIVLVGCSSSTPPPVAANAQIFKMGFANDEQSTWFKQSTKFAELLKQRSNGKLALSVFANSSLAGGDQVKELAMVQQGTIDFHLGSNILYSNIDPRYTVAMLPWLFTSNQQVDAVRTGALGKEMLAFAESKGIVGLCISDNGFRQLTNSKHEVKTPDDVKGLKIRIPPGKLYSSVFETLGATSVSIDMPKLSDALRDGLADGQETSVDTIASRNLYNVQKYMTLWNYSYSYIFLGVNKTLWNSFDPATQTMVRQAAEESCAFQINEYRTLVDSQVTMLKNKGMIVTTLSPDQVQAFRTKATPIYAQNEAAIGKDLMSRFQAVK